LVGLVELAGTDSGGEGGPRLREGTGRYEALCGRWIASASLVAAPDRYCRPCQVMGAWT
jgi:hypothetical protein